jgi:hypothetical protein
MHTMQHCRELVGGSLWWGAMLAIGIAAVANAAIFALAGLFGVPLEVSLTPGQPPQPLDLGMVVLATIVPALLAAGLLALLGRLTERPVRLFQWIAVVAFFLSLAGPVFQAVGATATLILMLMHLIAAATIVGVFSMAEHRVQHPAPSLH